MIRPCIAALALTLGTANAAAAQGWHERIWISVNGGAQTAGSGFSDTVELPVYTETASIKTDYPSKAGALADGSVGIRLAGGFGAGVAVSQSSASASASIDASIPHPLYDNQFRSVQGSTSVSHNELGVHLQLAYMVRVSERVRAVISAGPSWLTVEQTFVSDITYAEQYPYDTATFSAAKTHRASNTATGFNVGGDVAWMFTPRIGVGGIVRYTHATAHETVTAGHTVSVDAGGVQAGGGIRVAF
jgi:hypothetical protein